MSDSDDPNGGNGAGFNEAFGQRLAFAIDAAGGAQAVADRLGRGKNTPRRWADLEAKISLFDAWRVSEISGTSLRWIITGEGQPNEGDATNFDLVEEAARTVLEVAIELEQPMDPDQLARTIRRRAEKLCLGQSDRPASGLTSSDNQ